MKAYTLIAIFLSSILLVSMSCKKNKDQFPDCFNAPKKPKLTLTLIEGPTVSLPSKVSIFFRVRDNNGNPVGYLTEDNFVIYEQGLNDPCPRIISKFEAKRRISSREQVFNHTTMLVLDLSGSVLQQSLAKLQEAAIAFVQQALPDSSDNSVRIGIWWFDGEDILHELKAPTSDIWELKAAINSITPNISKDNSTDLYGAVIKSSAIAKNILQSYQSQDISAAVSVILFTDGEDRANRYLKQDAYQAVASSPTDISWFTLGVGNEINVKDLQTIGRNGFFQAANVAQLTEVFKQIGRIINNEANSYYLFEYCSPIRNGANNKLVIEAFDVNSNESGYLQATFDATGFTSGCQL